VAEDAVITKAIIGTWQFKTISHKAVTKEERRKSSDASSEKGRAEKGKDSAGSGERREE